MTLFAYVCGAVFPVTLLGAVFALGEGLRRHDEQRSAEAMWYTATVLFTVAVIAAWWGVVYG